MSIFIPLYKLSKYRGQEGFIPKLADLGSESWQKKKSKPNVILKILLRV